MDTDSESSRARLGPEIERRAVELDLRLQDVALRAKMTTGNLHKIRRGKISLTPLTKRRLEDALEWPHGHIDQRLIEFGDHEAELAALEEEIQARLLAIGEQRGREVMRTAAMRLSEVIRTEVERLTQREESDITDSH